jgi:uncharacterized membrane protein
MTEPSMATLPASSVGLSPLVAVHMTTALCALGIGPVALWARKGSRPHRAAGYAWVTLMVITAVSSFFIRDFKLPNVNGFTPIHLLIGVVFVSLSVGLRAMVQGNIQLHRKTMLGAYFGSCVVAGLFTLLPGRYLGQLVWHHWLGVL